MKKKILYGLLIIIVGIQFFRIDKTNPEINIINDFVEITTPPEDVTILLKSACYDCHSNETKYPWYSNVAPVSWWVKDHINEGREEMNFSEWGTYKAKKKDHKLEEGIEMLEKGEMPLNEYTWTHSEAKLTSEQKALLIDWFKAIRKAATANNNENELQLNNGEKWQVTFFTDSVIQNMVSIIIEDVEEGRMAYYVAMAQRIMMDIEALQESELKGDNNKEIMKLLIPISEMAMQLEEVETDEDALILQKDILKQLNKYADYFVLN